MAITVVLPAIVVRLDSMESKSVGRSSNITSTVDVPRTTILGVFPLVRVLGLESP